jgi:hypothetical protein
MCSNLQVEIFKGHSIVYTQVSLKQNQNLPIHKQSLILHRSEKIELEKGQINGSIHMRKQGRIDTV